MKIAALLAVAVLAALWIFVRRRQENKPEPVAPRPDRRVSIGSSTAYHAVAIKTSGHACASANELAGTRFLSAEAPTLPLPDCDVDDCQCSFVHYKDRRSGKDRRSPFSPAGSPATTGRFETERRAGSDRRENSDDYDIY